MVDIEHPIENKDVEEVDGFKIYKSESEGFVAFHKEVDTVVGVGETREEALKEAKKCANMHIENKYK